MQKLFSPTIQSLMVLAFWFMFVSSGCFDNAPSVGTDNKCTNGVQDLDEQGIDCGGSCFPCPTCYDNVKNGDELGVDCGGSCPLCPSCSDNVENGDELGVDCGGSCPPCPTCYDNVENGDELGVDCGGSCPPCPTCTGEPAVNCESVLSECDPSSCQISLNYVGDIIDKRINKICVSSACNVPWSTRSLTTVTRECGDNPADQNIIFYTEMLPKSNDLIYTWVLHYQYAEERPEGAPGTPLFYQGSGPVDELFESFGQPNSDYYKIMLNGKVLALRRDIGSELHSLIEAKTNMSIVFGLHYLEFVATDLSGCSHIIATKTDGSFINLFK